MSKYAKFVTAAVGAVLIGLQQFASIGDGSTIGGLPADQFVDAVLGFLTAAGVYAVPNTPA